MRSVGFASFALLVACSSGSIPSPDDMAPRAGDALSRSATPRSIFGDLLVEDWDARTGVSVSRGQIASFRGQVRGTTLVPVQSTLSPVLQRDGALFGMRPVVQCSGGSQLQVQLPQPIVAKGTRPYFAFVGRLRATRADDKGANLVGFNHVFQGPQADSGTQIRVHEDGKWAACSPAHSTDGCRSPETCPRKIHCRTR